MLAFAVLVAQNVKIALKWKVYPPNQIYTFSLCPVVLFIHSATLDYEEDNETYRVRPITTPTNNTDKKLQYKDAKTAQTKAENHDLVYTRNWRTPENLIKRVF